MSEDSTVKNRKVHGVICGADDSDPRSRIEKTRGFTTKITHTQFSSLSLAIFGADYDQDIIHSYSVPKLVSSFVST